MEWRIRRDLEAYTPALRAISLKVAAVQGINLGQGVCFLPTPELLIERAHEAARAGHNRYSPAQGIPELRSALAARLRSQNGLGCSDDEVLVTLGATGAFEAICSALLDPGDEVINFVPFYPYHRNTLQRSRAISRYVTLHQPDWKFDPEELRRAFNPRTKFILLTTPHNPTGKVFTRSELELIASLCQEHNVPCVTDETYEHMTYDGHEHISMATLPGMAERTITMGSYSKTFAITGWRIGFIVSPANIVELLRNINDQLFVCAPTPLQHAVAAGIRELPDSYYSTRLAEYEHKRKLMDQALSNIGLHSYAPQGAYYTVADVREAFPGIASEEVADLLVEKAGVGAVPASDFLGPEVKGDPQRSTFLRFCFACPDEQILAAGERLSKLKR